MWFHIGRFDGKVFHVTVQHMSCSHGMHCGGNKTYAVEHPFLFYYVCKVKHLSSILAVLDLPFKA